MEQQKSLSTIETKMVEGINIFLTDISRNRNVVVSSRQVAKHFGKRHDKLFSEIKRRYSEYIDCAENGGHPLFFENSYIHLQNNQTYKEYLMNRDGFVFLIMGFTGKEASKWKEKYIAAFNAMEAELKKRAAVKNDSEAPTGFASALLLAAKQAAIEEQRLMDRGANSRFLAK